MKLSSEMMQSLEKMQFETPTKVQGAAIEPMLAGNDLLVQAPTGTGKTAAFGIPIIEQTDPKTQGVETIILCPTRELALQTTKVLRDLSTFTPGVRMLTLYGGEPIHRQISALRRRPQIIIATPGRLLDHIQRRTVRLGTVQRVVLDEADQMLDMGFHGDIEKILQQTPTTRQTVLFSATLSREIRGIAAQYQSVPQEITIQQKALTVDRVEQYYTQVSRKDKQEALFQLLEKNQFVSPLVFVATKRMASSLSKKLNQNGYRSDALHGDLRQSQRNTVMKKYRLGKTPILVATDVAARGIDVCDVDAVINYDIPGDSDSYVHRIGRTGRANRNGLAYTLISSQEQENLQNISWATKASIQYYPLDGETLEDITPTQAQPEKKKRNSKKTSYQKRSNRNRSRQHQRSAK